MQMGQSSKRWSSTTVRARASAPEATKDRTTGVKRMSSNQSSLGLRVFHAPDAVETHPVFATPVVRPFWDTLAGCPLRNAASSHWRRAKKPPRSEKVDAAAKSSQSICVAPSKNGDLPVAKLSFGTPSQAALRSRNQNDAHPRWLSEGARINVLGVRRAKGRFNPRMTIAVGEFPR